MPEGPLNGLQLILNLFVGQPSYSCLPIKLSFDEPLNINDKVVQVSLNLIDHNLNLDI